MRLPLIALGMIATLCVGYARAATAPVGDRQYVREQHTVIVRGVPETWRLVWTGKPSTMCGPQGMDMAITCPCSGWAYGESGNLSLVRVRGGQEVERMKLAPLFGKFDYPAGEVGTGKAYLQRWPAKLSDFDRSERGDGRLVPEIKRRQAPQIMRPADYDHDGEATEFLIQVGTMPCGKLQFAAIGVSVGSPRLHALSSTAHPNKPLMMPLRAWQALLRSSHPGPVIVWNCGDHGSEVQSELILSASRGEIRAMDRDRACHADGSLGPPVKGFEL
ncbi:MAG: hypothetical protein JWP28_2522 [Phenylobacterium sp.]|jgi:hypothetical protein|uniref:hypothetical protein n=1 Tax=Phenylobacterium sp. TaxID=1871053 RepID=UPI002635B04E|nr:hypothetical protein [Phenylobacterium sp.]MDB5498491.1 hypothetical protein [Phenylobacterium sp.]